MFHANFSTKFAIWDYLFGTIYDPGFKPGNERENWGLYYDYPKDYFLQHAFSVKRFDEKALLKYKWFKFYYELRPNAIKVISAALTNINGAASKKSGRNESIGIVTGIKSSKNIHPELITEDVSWKLISCEPNN